MEFRSSGLETNANGCGCTRSEPPMWNSEDNLVELLPPLTRCHKMSPEDRTPNRLVGNHHFWGPACTHKPHPTPRISTLALRPRPLLALLWVFKPRTARPLASVSLGGPDRAHVQRREGGLKGVCSSGSGAFYGSCLRWRFCEEKGDEQNAAGQVSLFPSSGSWQVQGSRGDVAVGCESCRTCTVHILYTCLHILPFAFRVCV